MNRMTPRGFSAVYAGERRNVQIRQCPRGQSDTQAGNSLHHTTPTPINTSFRRVSRAMSGSVSTCTLLAETSWCGTGGGRCSA